MNTKLLIGIIVAAIVVIGGTWYAVSHVTPASPAQNTQTEATSTNSGSSSLADLWSMTGTRTCDVSSNDATVPFSGKVYLSGGQMRVDSTMQIPSMNNKNVHSHMIRKDGFFYTWSDLMPQGIKIAEPTSTPAAPSEVTPSAPAQGMNASAKVNYSCTPWVVDTSVFAPPTDITFTTMPVKH